MMTARPFIVFAITVGSAASIVRAEQPAEVRALIDAAIEAAGGRDALARYEQAFYCEHAVTLMLPQGRSAHAVEKSIKLLPEKMRYLSRAANVPKAPSTLLVVDGKKGWQMSTPETEVKLEQPARTKPVAKTAPSITGKGVEAMSPNTLKSHRDRLYAQWLTTLLPLSDEAFTLSMVAEVRIDEKPASGIKVKRTGHGDVVLLFDKSSSRLVGVDWGNIEQRFSDPAEADGLTYPTKITEYLNSHKFSEVEITKLEFLDSIDKRTFEKP